MQCKKCGNLLRIKNTSGLCRHCYGYIKNKERKVRLKKEHKCYDCSKKVEKKIIYHLRCDKCLSKNRKSLKTKKGTN